MKNFQDNTKDNRETEEKVEVTKVICQNQEEIASILESQKEI